MSRRTIRQFVAGATVPWRSLDAQNPRKGVTLASIARRMQVLPHEGAPCHAYQADGRKRGGLGLCQPCDRDVCWLNPFKYRKGHRPRGSRKG
jgi:hypothetical protein